MLSEISQRQKSYDLIYTWNLKSKQTQQKQTRAQRTNGGPRGEGHEGMDGPGRTPTPTFPGETLKKFLKDFYLFFFEREYRLGEGWTEKQTPAEQGALPDWILGLGVMT